jgi:hypothetical protein
MRKLILVAAIALMSTTPCYANLSLASNDAPSPVTAESTRPTADLPAHAAEKSATVVTPRRKHVSHVSNRASHASTASFVPLQSAHCE